MFLLFLLWQSKICKSFWNLFGGEIYMFLELSLLFFEEKDQLQHLAWNF